MNFKMYYQSLKKYIYLFIFGCVGSLLLHTGFLQLWQAQASHCSGFSCCGARALGAWASVVVVCGLSSCDSRAVQCRLSSCGSWAQLFHNMWDLPGPGLEPVSPALAGGFLTTVPPGKSYQSLFNEANDKEKYKFHIISHISLCVKGILHQADPYLEVYPFVIKPAKPSLEIAAFFFCAALMESPSLSSIPRKKNELLFCFNSD